MYNNRNKKEKEEINTLRTGSMDAWHLGNSASGSQMFNMDPARITQEYESLQKYNHMQYIHQMQIATGASNPLGLGISEEFFAPMHQVRIEGLPPGLPPGRKHESDNKPKFTRANMTYLDYKRSQPGYVEPQIPTTYETNNWSSNERRSNSAKKSDPRGSYNNGKSSQPKTDDGWGDDDCSRVQKKIPEESDDWDVDDNSAPTTAQKKPIDFDWDEISAPSETQKKNNPPKKSNDDLDEWDDASPPQSQNKNPIKEIDWDNLDNDASTSSAQPKAKVVDWDNFDNDASTSSAQPKVKVVDWDNFDNDASTSSAQPKVKTNDDWSEAEDSAPPKKYERQSSGSSQSRGGYRQSYHDREGSHSSRNSSDSRGGRFSRDRSSSFRGNSKENSRDRFRSNSHTSHGSDHSGNRQKSFEPRQPRPGDWDCSKCKTNNFHFRFECFRCHEPKGDDVHSSSGNYRSRDSSSYRGSFRGNRDSARGRNGNSSGGFKNNRWSGDKKNDIKPANSGWSDDEGDKKPHNNGSSSTQKRKSSTTDDWDNNELNGSTSKKQKQSSPDEWDVDNGQKDLGKLSKEIMRDDDFWNNLLTDSEKQPSASNGLEEQPIALNGSEKEPSVSNGSEKQPSASNGTEQPLSVKKDEDDEWDLPKEKNDEKQPQQSEAKSSNDVDDEWE